MSPERWKQIETLYHSARDCDAGGREAFLRDACGDDHELLDQLKLLLEQDRSDHEILDRPAMDLLSEACPDELSAGTILGPYRIEGLLGAGGMGQVYKAHDSRLDRMVAIKLAGARFSDRFGREARATAALNHPNICTLHDIGPNYLVMELVEGPTLADRIRQGALSLDEALPIARQLAEALEAAHEKGVVHRDLKPANIKIRPDGTVKVLDFGLAKAASAETPQDSAAWNPEKTEQGRIVGTAAYMSPEQARGEKVDKRTDIWAFGVVLYEMLAGQRPFQGATASDTIATVLKEHPDFTRVPEGARRLLQRCLEKNPKLRLRDIGDAIPLVVEDPRVRLARRPWLAWSMAAALLAALAVSLAHFREGSAFQEPRRFQIALPENIKLTSGGAMAVSPDGRRLVFAAIGPDNVPRLWLRYLNSFELKPLQGSEIDPIEPTVVWSPDSRFVAFRKEQKLQKLDVSGGLPQTLCEGAECKALANLVGGSWNRNNTIIFASGLEPHAVVRVSAGGGVPTPVTAPSGTHHGHSYPSFLPDGQHFLYARWSEDADARGIFVGSLADRPEAQDSRMLLRFDVPSGVSMYVPSSEPHFGELLFMRERTLMAQRFDERQLSLSGEPVIVADHVASNNVGTGLFSASTNGVLVYKTGAGVTKQFTWLDRSGKVSSTPGEPGRYGTNMLRISPDGTQALYTQRDGNTNIGAVWVEDLVRGGTVRVTSGRYESSNPVWSLDGRSVAYGSNRDGFAGIYRNAASGIGSEALLVKLSLNPWPPHPYEWTPDGRFLVYSVHDPKTRLDLWALPMEGNPSERKPVPILSSESNEYDARVSPDGRWIAYLSDESGRYEIYVQPFFPGMRSAAEQPKPEKRRISNGARGMAHWRSDGRELLYMSLDGEIMALPVTPGPRFQAGRPQVLFRTPGDLFRLSVTPAMMVDPTPDHQRFLLLLPPVPNRRDEFAVVLNWMEGLRK